MEPNPSEIIAAIDLGSNSFHMIVAKLRDGELLVVDRLKEMVRLAAGFNEKKHLTEEAQQRALECLERFVQRLRDLPYKNFRAVGTNTLRSAHNSSTFLIKANQALGHSIDVISGIEEARLIYKGVAHGLAFDNKRRLIIDIGGGSTEFIIGSGMNPLKKESLNIGCVSSSGSHFIDGKISAKRMKRAIIAAQQELEPMQWTFRTQGWDEVVGSSGTLRAVDKILHAMGWSKEGITLNGLKKLQESLLQAGHVENLRLPELSPERTPVFAGGVAIICASFKTLGIKQMKVSDGALREGLLYELVGRIRHEDIRVHSVNSLAKRYDVDLQHTARIINTIQHCLDQISLPKNIEKKSAAQWLEWAATLHEIGLGIAHNQYNKHGAYIIENADLAGFSRQDQKLLATLVKNHRRKFSVKTFNDFVKPWNTAIKPLALILRLAVLLHRSRHSDPIPNFKLSLNDKSLRLSFPEQWLEEHPLTQADLKQEANYLKPCGIKLKF